MKDTAYLIFNKTKIVKMSKEIPKYKKGNDSYSATEEMNAGEFYIQVSVDIPDEVITSCLGQTEIVIEKTSEINTQTKTKSGKQSRVGLEI